MRNAEGFTLIEMLTATAVAATMATAALPSMSSAVSRHTLGTAVTELMLTIELGRSESIASGTRVVLAPKVGRDWSSGWQLYRDLNNNGALDDGEPVVRDFAAPDRRLQFTAHGVLQNATMSFEEQGFVRQAGTRNGLMLGRLNVVFDGQVRTLCFSAARVRVVAGSYTCS